MAAPADKHNTQLSSAYWRLYMPQFFLFHWGFPGGASSKKKKQKNKKQPHPPMQEMWETWFWSLGQKDSLETHPSILVWRIPRAEEPGGPQFIGL